MTEKARASRAYSIRKSTIHGRGIFAARDLQKGEKIIEYKGALVDWDSVDGERITDPTDPYHTFLMGVEDGRVIDGAVNGNASRYLNHSCDGNCEAIEEDDSRVFIMARKAIKAGTELNYDYKLNPGVRITKKLMLAYACRCGSAKCRKTMLDLG